MAKPPDNQPENTPDAQPPQATKRTRFHVKLAGLDGLVLEAADAKEAWSVYKQRMGILGALHQPVILEAPELPLSPEKSNDHADPGPN